MMNISLTSIGKLLTAYKVDEWLFYADLAGDHQSAFVLRRIIIWYSSNTVQQRKNKEFWKTYEQMSQETGLSKYQIQKAQKQLSKVIQVTVRRYKGLLRTYYRVKKRALLTAIGALLSRYTGKRINLLQQKTRPTLDKKLDDSRVKNSACHSLTSYSIQSISDQQTHTSSTEAPQETQDNKQTLDDDLQSLPDFLKNYSFTGECDVAGFIEQINRLGEDVARAKFEKTSQIGKSWSYHLNSLINEPTPQQPETDNNDEYSDMINKPAPVAQVVPMPEHTDKRWIAIRQQYEMQFNRFELSGSKCAIEGDQAIITIQSAHYQQAINTSDHHPRGITFWIKREIESMFGIDNPTVQYITAEAIA